MSTQRMICVVDPDSDACVARFVRIYSCAESFSSMADCVTACTSRQPRFASPNRRLQTFDVVADARCRPDEQAAIAAVLSDMDAELAALEARRDKTRDLKQAMMQELLTGKTRLVNG